jgi:hypothetical protein
MTTPSTPRKAGPLLGTGAQTSWPFTFKVFAASDIAVTIANNLGVETALVLNTDYSVSVNANQDTSPGGTVTYPLSGSPLPVGSKLTIIGNLPYDQPLDLPSGGNFSPLALENELDRLAMQIQQLRELTSRSLQVPVSDSNVGMTLPTAVERANKVLGFTTGGEPTVSQRTLAEIDAAVGSFVNNTGNNAATVLYTPAGAGADITTVQAKLRETVSLKDFGAVGDGSVNDSAAILDALQSGAQYVYVPSGTYAMASNISATIATDVTFYGHGKIIYTGATNSNPLFSIQTGNNSFKVDGISFDGDNKIAAGMRITNSAVPSSNTLPNCTVSNNLFIRFRMNVAGIWNDAVYLEGSFQLVTIANNRVRLITRAAGTGTPSSVGTAGITVTPYSATQFIRECLHYGNQYAAILGDDAVSSPNNVDHDAFRFFGPNPAADSGQYAQATVTSYGNVFRNCRGRAIKIQAIGSVSDETIIRDDDYTNYGGSVEINFQYGVGVVSNCQFIYRPYASTSPIQTGLSLVSFYQGSDYGEDTGSAIVNGIQVLNSIPAGVGNNIAYIVAAGVGSGVATPLKPLISVSNVSVNKNPITAIAQIGYEGTTYGTLRLDNITVPELVWGAVATNGTDTNFDIVATNVMNVDGVSTPANAKPFITTTLGASTSYGGAIMGAMNQGFLNQYANIGSNNKGPMLAGGALSDPQNRNGGAASVQSFALADDASGTFDSRFYNIGRGLFIVSVNYDYTTQGVFVTGGNAIYSIAAPAGSLFEVSTAGTNPNVDGKFNMWFTGGQLNVKNRLGDTYIVTVTFIG